MRVGAVDNADITLRVGLVGDLHGFTRRRKRLVAKGITSA